MKPSYQVFRLFYLVTWFYFITEVLATNAPQPPTKAGRTVDGKEYSFPLPTSCGNPCSPQIVEIHHHYHFDGTTSYRTYQHNKGGAPPGDCGPPLKSSEKPPEEQIPVPRPVLMTTPKSVNADINYDNDYDDTAQGPTYKKNINSGFSGAVAQPYRDDTYGEVGIGRKTGRTASNKGRSIDGSADNLLTTTTTTTTTEAPPIPKVKKPKNITFPIS